MSDQTRESTLSNSAISEYAELVGRHHGIYSFTGRADVKQLVSKLGGTVDVSESIFASEALTVFGPDDGFVVHLPPLTSDRRDRFTIAHELGHYFLHYLVPGLQGKVSFGRGEKNRTETQANVFASSLLMPAEYFRDAYRRLGSDWFALGDEFGVSAKAAEVRAQVLRL